MIKKLLKKLFDILKKYTKRKPGISNTGFENSMFRVI